MRMIDFGIMRRAIGPLLLVFVLVSSANVANATRYAFFTIQTTTSVRSPTVTLQPGTAGSSTISNGVYAAVTVSSAMPQFYVTITLKNSQGSATSSPFQVLIQPDPSLYSTHEATNLGNIRFCADTFCTVTFYSWLEGCGASSPYGSCSTSSTSAAFWIRLTSSIAAGGGVLTIYMAFLTTTSNFDGNVAGESPTLSSTYAQFDNGANVFNFYDNFAGTSGPSSSLWTTSYFGSAGTFATNNMLTITCAAHSAYNAAVVEKTALTTPEVAEADLASQTGNQFTDVGEGSAWDATANGVANNGYTISWNGQTGAQFDRFWVDTAGTRTMLNTTAAGSIPNFPSGVWHVSWYATGHEEARDGVGNPGAFVQRDSTVSMPSTYVMVIGEASSSGASGTISVQWARMRSTPPNDVMPSVSLGGIAPAANGLILTFTNLGSTSWLANLAVVTTANTARLNNLTISFKNPNSKQIVLGASVPNQNSGPQVTLAATSTTSIVMGVTVSSSGTTTVNIGLKIQSPPSPGVASVYCYDVIALTVN